MLTGGCSNVDTTHQLRHDGCGVCRGHRLCPLCRLRGDAEIVRYLSSAACVVCQECRPPADIPVLYEFRRRCSVDACFGASAPPGRSSRLVDATVKYINSLRPCVRCRTRSQASLEYNLQDDSGQMTARMKQATRFFIIGGGFFMMGFPAGTVLYCMTNTACMAVQGFVLRQDGIRRLLGWPLMSEMPKKH